MSPPFNLGGSVTVLTDRAQWKRCYVISKARSEKSQLVCLGLWDIHSWKLEPLCIKSDYPEKAMQDRPPVSTPAARPS